VFCLFAVFSLNAAAFAEEVKVPVTVALSKPVAGVQFEFSYTDGLEFVALEKSEAFRSAMSTPTAARDGNTYVGIFSSNNDFAPIDGELNVGYLVFNHSGKPNQTVLVTEVKLVEVIDKNTTQSEAIILLEEIKVPLSGISAAMSLGSPSLPEKATPIWMIIAVIVCVLFCAACFVIIRQRRQLLGKGKAPEAPQS